MQGVGAGSDNEDCLEFSDIRDFEFEDSLRSVACGGHDNHDSHDRDRSECVPLSPVPHPYACQPQPLYPSSSCCRMSDVCSVPGPFATAPDLPAGIVMDPDSGSSAGGAGDGAAAAAAAAAADSASKTEFRTLQRAVYGLWFATIVLAAIVILLTFFPSMVHLSGSDDGAGAGAGAGLTVKVTAVQHDVEDAKSQAVALAKMLAAVEDAQHRAESLLDKLQTSVAAAAARTASREELNALREGLLPQITANADAEGMLEQSLSSLHDRLATLAQQVVALEGTAAELRARTNTTAQAASATAAAQEENARRIGLLEGSVPAGSGATSGGDALAMVEQKLEAELRKLRTEAEAERGKLAATQADVRRVNETSHEEVGRLRAEVAAVAKDVAAVRSSVDELRSGTGSTPQAGQATASPAAATTASPGTAATTSPAAATASPGATTVSPGAAATVSPVAAATATPGAAATPAGLESDVGRLEERVGALEALSATVADDVASAHATLAQVQHVVDNLRTDEALESLRADVASAQNSIGGAEQSIRDLDSALAAVRSDAATTQTNLTATNEVVAVLRAASDAGLEALQTDVAAAQSSIAGAEGDIQGLETRLVGVEAALGKLEGDAAATQGNVTALEGDVRELDAAFEASTAEVDKALQKLQAEAASTQESVRTLNDTTGLALGQLRADVKVAQDNVTAAADGIRELDSRFKAHVATANLTLGSLQANATAAEEAFDDLDAAFKTHVEAADGALAAVRSDAATMRANLTTTNEAVGALQTDVAAAQDSIAGAEGDIQGLEAHTTKMDTSLDALEGELAAAQSSLEVAEGGIRRLELRQGNLQTGVDNLEAALGSHTTASTAALGTLNTNVGALQSRVTAAEGSIVDLRTNIGDVAKTASDAQTIARNLFSNNIMPLGGRVTTAEKTIKELQTAVSGHADVQEQIDYTLSELAGLENALHLVKHSTAHVTWGEELRLAVNELRGKLTAASANSEASVALLAEQVAKQGRPPESLLRLGDVKMGVEANGLAVNWDHAGVPFPVAASPADARYHIKGWVSRNGVVFEATFGLGVTYGVRCSVAHLATLACVGRRGVWYTGAATLGLTHGVFEATVEVSSRGIMLSGDTLQERAFDRTYVPSYVTSSARAEGVMEYAGRWASPADVPRNELYQFTESLVTYNGMPMIPGHTVGNVYSGATYKGDDYFGLYVAAARHRRIPNVGQLWNGNSQLAVPSIGSPSMKDSCQATTHDFPYPPDYANDFNGPLIFNCDPGTVLTGVRSWHENQSQDRRFMFRCSSLACSLKL